MKVLSFSWSVKVGEETPRIYTFWRANNTCSSGSILTVIQNLFLFRYVRFLQKDPNFTCQRIHFIISTMGWLVKYYIYIISQPTQCIDSYLHQWCTTDHLRINSWSFSNPVALVIQTNVDVDVETQSLQTLACPSFIETSEWFSEMSFEYGSSLCEDIHWPSSAGTHHNSSSKLSRLVALSGLSGLCGLRLSDAQHHENFPLQVNKHNISGLSCATLFSGLMFAAILTLNNVKIFLLANGLTFGSSSSLLDFSLKQLETVREMGEFRFFSEKWVNFL